VNFRLGIIRQTVAPCAVPGARFTLEAPPVPLRGICETAA